MFNNSLTEPVKIDQVRQKKIYDRQLQASKNPVWQEGHSAGIDTGMMIVYLELMEAVRLAGQDDQKSLKEYANKANFPGGFLEAVALKIVEGCRATSGGGNSGQ